MPNGPYVLARLSDGNIGELDSSLPGGTSNPGSGPAMQGLDLKGTSTGSEVVGIMGFPIYGAKDATPANFILPGQVLAMADVPTGVGLVQQWYPKFTSQFYEPAVPNGTGSTIPQGTFVNLYDASGTLKMRPANLSSGTVYPAHGITTKDATVSPGVVGNENVANVVMGSIVGGFRNQTTPFAALLTPGTWYWLDNANPGSYTATKPTGAGDKHQIVGYASSDSEMFILPLPALEDLTGGGTITVLATNSTGSSIAARTLVNLYDVSGTTTMRPSDLTTTPRRPALGITTQSVANGAVGSVTVLGVVGGFTSLTPGHWYWTHTVSAGVIDYNKPSDLTKAQRIGYAASATEMVFIFGDFEASIGGGGINSGSSFPGSPNDKDLYVKTPEYELALYITSLGYWVSPTILYDDYDTNITNGSIDLKNLPLAEPDNGIILESLNIKASADTVQNGTDYYSIELRGTTGTVYASATTDTFIGSVINTDLPSVQAGLATPIFPPTEDGTYLHIGAHGTPGTLNIGVRVGYRKILG